MPDIAPGAAADLVCPGCGAQMQITAFPALYRAAATGASAELVIADGEATCFYHPEKRAAAPCDSCGRFLCALCDVGLDGKHYCPACLEAGSRKGKLQSLERSRTRYDQVVWSLLVLPLVLCWVAAPITATAALILAIWKWRAPGSLVANTRLRLALAMAVALVEMAGSTWIWAATFLRS